LRSERGCKCADLVRGEFRRKLLRGWGIGSCSQAVALAQLAVASGASGGCVKRDRVGCGVSGGWGAGCDWQERGEVGASG
jgi:hypothetical protein